MKKNQWRELRLRLLAMVTSLALLLGAVRFAPFNLFSLVGGAAAAGTGDYDWLLDTVNHGRDANHPYLISTAGQLQALAKLVEGLSEANPVMTITIGASTYTVGPNETGIFAASLLAERIPIPTVEPTVEPTETPEPTPAETPAPTQTEEPAPTPSESPEPTPELTPAPTSEPTPEEPPTPEPTPEEPPTPEESPAPVPSPEPTPSEAPAPSETPLPTPSQSAAPTVPPEGEPTPSEEPTPVETLEPAPTEGNTQALLGAELQGVGGSILVPIGMAGRFFKLQLPTGQTELSLADYNGKTFEGGMKRFWTPIGILATFDANGNPEGNPFLGTFDGNNVLIKGFQYAPNPALIESKAMAGYGLFGFVGETGEVKNLKIEMNIPWQLHRYQNGDTAVTELPLGVRDHAVGVVAAADTGKLSNCTVTRAKLSWSLVPTTPFTAVTAVGGIVGLLAGGAVENCVFLGEISNKAETLSGSGNARKAYARQRVGGVAGFLSGGGLTQCAAGVDIDVYNSGYVNDADPGGVGGLLGYGTAAATIESSFTTGRLYAKHSAGGLVGRIDAALTINNSFSTAALGTTKTAGPSGIDGDFTLDATESIGGLLGNSNNTGAALANVYFAGGLLAPQFGTVAGRWQGGTLVNVGVDATQVPHGPAKYNNQAITAPARNLDGFGTSSKPLTGWTNANGFLPQLSWAAASANTTIIKPLSQAATRKYFTLDNSNSIAGSGTDTERNLYRLKEIGGKLPTLGTYLKPDSTSIIKSSDGTKEIGGRYTYTEVVDGNAIPIARWGVTAANQEAYKGNPSEKANQIDGPGKLLTLLDRVNLAGGGYLGGSFTLAGGTMDASAAPIPVYSGQLTPFCGKLTGGTATILSGLRYQKNATGLFDSVYGATFTNFKLRSPALPANEPLGTTAAPYFGLLAGQMAASTLTNVDVDIFLYRYQNDTADNYYHSNPLSIGLVGTLAYVTVGSTFADCDITGLDIAITGLEFVRVNAGGLLGFNNSRSALTIKTSTVSGSIAANFGAASDTVDETTFSNVGGLVGNGQGNAINVTSCRVSANLQGMYVGGLIGRSRSGTFKTSVFSGNVETSPNWSNSRSAVAYSGGLAGYSNNGSATTSDQCAVFGNISSAAYAGGLFGYFTSSQVAIKNSYVSAIVKAAAPGGAAGGMLGYAAGLTANNSYLVGQVSAPGTYGALAGKITGTAAFTSTMYDSTLTQPGIATVGSLAEDPFILTGAAVKPGDAAWGTLASDTKIWAYTAGTRSYPQLVWLNNATTGFPALSTGSTRQLFDNPANIPSVYDFPDGGAFSVTLPAGITAEPGPPPSSFEKIAPNSYTATGEEAEGPLNFIYSGVQVNGAPLKLPYTIGKHLFDYGDGTAAKPFIIYDLAQLKIFRSFVNSSRNAAGVHYQISTPPIGGDFTKCDKTTIDMSGIADWRGTTAALAGKLDGYGSTLTNLTTSGWKDKNDTYWSAGFLGGLADGSEVKNLTITGATITSPADLTGLGHAAGILAATAKAATVANVRVQGTIQADRDVHVGGFIGNVDGGFTLKNSIANITVTAMGGDGEDDAGAGGLIGNLAGVNNATATISECASYGSIDDWGGLGGLVGHLSAGKLNTRISDSYSLAKLSDTGISGTGVSISAGGFIGKIDNLSPDPANANKVVVDSCYYAGENKITNSSGRRVGAYVGAALISSRVHNNGRDFRNLNLRNCAYNSDGNRNVPANLYYRNPTTNKDAYNGRYAWPEYSDKDKNTGENWVRPEGDTSGAIWYGQTTSFQMSQGEGNRENEIAAWDTAVWQFDDGLYPRLKNTMAPDSLILDYHLAIHYTRAGGTDRFANVFVRYGGAALSLPDAKVPLLVTKNRRMAVATGNGAANTAVDITIGAAKRTIRIFPSTDATGNRDVSIYYVNQDAGMWEGPNKVWTVYTADALAGLATLFSNDPGDAADQNGIKKPDLGALAGGEIRLGKDIDLGTAYSGMRHVGSWRPIGSQAVPFDITFNGNHQTLYDLAVNPFYETAIEPQYTYADLAKNTDLGLFGYIGPGGVVKNLTLTTRAGAAGQSVYRQPGVRVGRGVTSAGAVAAVMTGGRLENCLVNIPVYTLADTPRYSPNDGKTEVWDAVKHLGARADAPLGGLVGEVRGSATIQNCAYTGYVYAEPQSLRPGVTAPPPTDTTTGPVGGLVGRVTAGALTLTDSYAAAYVDGTNPGALIGGAAGTLTLNGTTAYDGNAVGRTNAAAVGSDPGLAVSDTVEITPDGRYPLPAGLSDNADTSAARLRLDISAHAGSATSGTLLSADGTIAGTKDRQPGLTLKPGVATTNGRSFSKGADGGLTQLELQLGGAARRVLVNLRCWYDEGLLADRHFTISTAEELWELSEIVRGTIGGPESKVAHGHNISGGLDDFAGATVTLAADIDLSKLTDGESLRSWLPIGTDAHPFRGAFEGHGHSVARMKLESANPVQGLFGTVDGTVQNLLVSAASLKLPENGKGGILTARLLAGSSITACGAAGTVDLVGNGAVAGGLVGESAGTVTESFSTAELYGADGLTSGTIGGIAGTLAGSIDKTYFTGLINAAGGFTIGGIAGEQTKGATVAQCYVSAYLPDSARMYRISETPGEHCYYDGRHLTGGKGGVRADGAGLTMPSAADWNQGGEGRYPVPIRFGGPGLQGTALHRAAELAAAIFTFSGSVGANYARFQSVTVSVLAASGYTLRSGNPLILAVSGDTARPVEGNNGQPVLRLAAGGEPTAFLRPCWLVIPTLLAVTYRFNWDELIRDAGLAPGPNFNGADPTKGDSRHIRSVADWNSFVTLAGSGAGGDYYLERDIDFGGAAISTVNGPFYGQFHGGGHTLSNFAATAPLFRSVEKGGKVELLGLSGGHLAVTFPDAASQTTALVAGRNDGRIVHVAADSCTVTVTRTVAGQVATTIGGLVGENNGVLENAYFYTPLTNDPQVMSVYPAGAVPILQRMGGLVGVNTGTMTGCYAALTPRCTIGTEHSGGAAYFSALAGRNSGTIRFSYWRFAFAYNEAEPPSLSAYRYLDGTVWKEKPGAPLFAQNIPLEQTARWLSADSYGGTYHVEDNRLKLYPFKLARYDLTGIFGSAADQYLMLALQFGAGDNAMSAVALCSWKGYLVPNFANLQETATLNVSLPMLSSKLGYALSGVSVIQKETLDLDTMADRSTQISGLEGGGYRIASLGENAARVFLDLKLTARGSEWKPPWGVFRKDTSAKLS